MTIQTSTGAFVYRAERSLIDNKTATGDVRAGGLTPAHLHMFPSHTCWPQSVRGRAPLHMPAPTKWG
jgi:hypothetical protein